MRITRSIGVSIPRCALLAAAGGLLVLGSSLRAANEEAPAGAPPDMAEMMKKMETLAAPGPEHQVLAAMAGEWEAEAKCFMAPGAPPTVSKGTSRNTMLLGGRVLREEFEGDMAGKKLNGIAMTTYDRFNRKYVSVWMDDMGPGMFTSEGTSDAAGKVLTLTGKMDDPMTGEKGKSMKLVTRILSPDKRVFEMHDLSLGEKSKTMEITYTRKGGGALAGRP